MSKSACLSSPAHATTQTKLFKMSFFFLIEGRDKPTQSPRRAEGKKVERALEAGKEEAGGMTSVKGGRAGNV